MPKIEEILRYDRSREPDNLVLFLEGKFWKAYERSAYVLTRLYGFKPTKRYIKLIGEEVISVGFPEESLPKYLGNAQVDREKRILRAVVRCPLHGQTFEEWKSSTCVRESAVQRSGEEQGGDNAAERVQRQHARDIGLPVFRLVYDLLFRLFHDCAKMGKDYRYTLGEDIKRNLLRIEVLIYRANACREAGEKVDYLREALDRLLEVKIYVRILHDSKQLSLKRYTLLCEQMVAVEQQLEHWCRYTETHSQKRMETETIKTNDINQQLNLFV